MSINPKCFEPISYKIEIKLKIILAYQYSSWLYAFPHLYPGTKLRNFSFLYCLDCFYIYIFLVSELDATLIASL